MYRVLCCIYCSDVFGILQWESFQGATIWGLDMGELSYLHNSQEQSQEYMSFSRRRAHFGPPGSGQGWQGLLCPGRPGECDKAAPCATAGAAATPGAAQTADLRRVTPPLLTKEIEKQSGGVGFRVVRVWG